MQKNKILSAFAIITFSSLSTSNAAGEQLLSIIDPHRAAEGWIELFDRHTLFGWESSPEQGWLIKDDILSWQQSAAKGLAFVRTTTPFLAYELLVDAFTAGAGKAWIGLNVTNLEEPPGRSGTWIALSDTDPQWPAGSIVPLAKSSGRVHTAGRWVTLRVIVAQPQIKVILDDVVVCSTTVERLPAGSLVFCLENPEKSSILRFSTIRLKPLGLKALFNGKDLTGWKVHPRSQSKYFVTPEGWLAVQNGPGDIQSEGLFGDFVLQLQVLTLGQHLNSGVFFRAIPGEFWAGYESQIRNQWRNDRTQPVDYGTGGIYNRQPARIVASDDLRWFTKTIVASKRHFSVWVDGLQVADWTDMRGADQNPRRGYRAEPGCISLQGHDPTTDLRFKNIYIAPLD